METLSIKELSNILNSISTTTLQTYLSNYKFNKFKKSVIDGINARYEISEKFLSTLFTDLWNRNRIKEAETIRKYFKNFNVKILPWEEFII